MRKRGKKYNEVVKLVDHDKIYTPQEACALVGKLNIAQFNASVDLHLRMNLDSRKADQQIRGTVLLPSGSGKVVRIAVFAEGDGARLAQEAGADVVGGDDLVAKVQGGWLEFDVAMATPSMMGKVGRLGKVLGPRGLMPNPKTNTVVAPEELPRVIREARQGRVEYRLDKMGSIHVPVGKVQFTPEQLMANLSALMEAISRAKPSSVKGIYIKKITMAPSMGPGIRVDVNQSLELKAA
ncbi:MAG: 50S ribosomal protein L1 [Chloroflexi bacterium ADurb.Bin180]|nr:MAG: 50S ribosomal protein L1 [Chloroflexi bacterium ADurb.Bin180]HNR97598.1 50S ribosomal protein L1 [Anaerolineae bacterium]HNT06232.1 50S ribosomal protein L1 [Anaerolineae bacterium]HOU24978.1 50S ribosomal protein L1 [Anaerolineae bacterium]HQJ52199.1 50S ribosomal protein L1 [Anaerolineae bacterium]